MNSQTFLVILYYIKFASSQLLHQSEIDARLSNANDGRIYKENRIAKIFTEYSKQIQNCSSLLKSSNAPQDVSTSLDNFNSLIQQLSTIKNFETYKNISTCGDINYKITMMEFEQRKLFWIREKITFNVSLTYKQHAELVRAYQLNLNALGFLSKNERMVAKIVSDLSDILRSLFEYFGILSVDIANLVYFNVILSVFKENYCQCLKTVSWTGKGSTYDANIQAFEDKLTQLQSRIITFTSTSLSKVSQAGTLSANLQTLQTFLKNILTTSDYMKITWKNIQDCNDFYNRMKFLEFKRFQYIQILSSANVNRTYLIIYHQRVNSTMNNQKSISDILTSTLGLQNVYLHYISLLSFSIGKISRMIFDFDFYGDTFCSCEPGNVETSSLATTMSFTTTTTKPTTVTTTSTSTIRTTTIQTTTTIAPRCGDTYSLKSFDPSDPVTPGLESGEFLDNSTVYPGHGNFGSECLGPSTAAIVLGSTKYPRGAYSPCQPNNPMKFDNVSARFYWAHPDLKWVRTDTKTTLSVPGALSITIHDGHTGCLGFVGRFNFTSNGSTYSTIGHLWNKAATVMFWTGATTVSENIKSFEVLACQTA